MLLVLRGAARSARSRFALPRRRPLVRNAGRRPPAAHGGASARADARRGDASAGPARRGMARRAGIARRAPGASPCACIAAAGRALPAGAGARRRAAGPGPLARARRRRRLLLDRHRPSRGRTPRGRRGRERGCRGRPAGRGARQPTGGRARSRRRRWIATVSRATSWATSCRACSAPRAGPSRSTMGRAGRGGGRGTCGRSCAGFAAPRAPRSCSRGVMARLAAAADIITDPANGPSGEHGCKSSSTS